MTALIGVVCYIAGMGTALILVVLAASKGVEAEARRRERGRATKWAAPYRGQIIVDAFNSEDAKRWAKAFDKVADDAIDLTGGKR